MLRPAFLEMTKVRAAVVCEESLHRVGKKLNFNKFIKLGKSEKKIGKKLGQQLWLIV